MNILGYTIQELADLEIPFSIPDAIESPTANTIIPDNHVHANTAVEIAKLRALLELIYGGRHSSLQDVHGPSDSIESLMFSATKNIE